jgi:ABC-type Fe3+-siderophore transport system permease subunit
MDSVIAEIGSSLLNAVPDIIAWTFGIVLAVIMLRRDGLKPEKLLLAGCCLMLAVTVLSPIVRELVMDWVRGNNASYLTVGQTMSYTQIPLAVLSLAGIICLVIAFWIKFRVKKQGEI